MDRRRILRLFVIPTAVGLAAAAGVLLLLRGGPAGGGQQQETVPVVVARRAVPAQATLTAEDLAVRQVPKGLAVGGSLGSPAEAVGKRTLVRLAEGEPVLRSLLDLPENRGGLAAKVPPGLRALTFAVNDLTGLAGRLQPGDRVDVAAFVAGRGGAPARAVLLLEDVPVLALGRAQDEAAGSGAGRIAPPYGSVTVAVRPEDAVLLTLAQRQAQLQLLLRPAGEERARGRITVTEDALQ